MRSGKTTQRGGTVETEEGYGLAAEPMDLAMRGFAAWQRGDLETVEEMLDPGVQWSWYEAGSWDCHSRDEVMRTLHERHEQGFSRSELEFLQAGSNAVIVVVHPGRIAGPDWPDEVATIVTFRGGKVVNMQDYRTRQEALTAAALM